MAKKIQIDIEVNGKMQKATVSANKLRSALDGVSTSQDKVSKSARTADRNLKGVSQQSANGTKNFSKMAQGIGGTLVPAYATLAANLFAVSAAFEFLKRASQVSRLEKAQQSFAANTGKALGFMTEKLIDASNGMLSFQEAAQAAAIGTAKGFSGPQLESLAVGAQKAAQALGRDFGDAFDRLIRGVSKAEPELLDELGITLRLETATKNYADALGLQADKLTDAQRSQAVLLETQRQLDDQYANQEIIADPFIKLQKTFTDIVKTITDKVLPIFSVFADILNRNATLAIAAFAAFAVSIIRAIVPFDKFSDKIDEWKDGHQAAVDKAKDDLKEYRKALERTNATAEKMREKGAKIAQAGAKRAMAAGATSPILSRLAQGGVGALKGPDKANLEKALRSAELQYERSGKITKGIFADVGIDIARQIGKGLKAASAESRKTEGRFKRFFTTISLEAKIAGANINKFISGGLLKLEGPLKRMGKIVKLFGRGIFAAFSVQTLIEIFQEWILAFDSMLKFFAKGFDWLGSKIGLDFGLEEMYEGSPLQKTVRGWAKDVQLARDQSEILRDVQKDINAFSKSVASIEEGAPKFGAIENLNALSTLNLGDTIKKIGELDEGADKSNAIAEITNQWKKLSEALGNEKLSAILDNNSLSFEQQAQAIAALGTAAGATAADNTAFTDRLSQQASVLKEGSIENIVAYIEEMQAASNAIKETSSATGELIDRQEDVDGLFGGRAKQILDTYAEIRSQTEALRDAEQETAMARERAKTLDPLTQERANIALKISDQENKVAKAKLDQIAAEEVLRTLSDAQSGADAKALQNAKDKLTIAQNTLDLENLRLDVVNELADTELKINDIKKAMEPLKLDQRRLALSQTLLSQEEKRLSLIKEQVAAVESIIQYRFDRLLRDSQSLGGNLDPKRELKARIVLEQALLKNKIDQINREFKMKVAQNNLEQKTLKNRNKLARLEFQKLALEEKLSAQEVTQTLALYDEIEKGIDATAAMAQETAIITRDAALRTADLTLQKLKDQLTDLSFERQMAQTFENSFRDGLNNALSGLISGDMNFKEAMLSFINTIADAAMKKLQDMLVDAIMDALFGPEEDLADKMERILKEEQLSTKVGETIEDSGDKMAKKLDDVLSQEIQTRVKVECCKESEDTTGDLATLATGIMSVGGLVAGGGEYNMGEMGGVIPTMGSQTSEWFTNAAGMEEMVITASPGALTFSEKIAAAVDGVPLLGDLMYKLTGGDSGGGLLQTLGKIFASPLGLLGNLFGGGKGFADGSSFASMPTPTGIPFGPAAGGEGGAGIFSQITSMFSKFLYGSKGIGGAPAEGILGFISNIFGGSEGFAKIGQLIMKLLSPILAPILALFGGGFGGVGGPAAGAGLLDIVAPVAGMFGFARYGGIMTPPKGYRTGGIASGSSAGYPALLHGREAVVPLPHGDKIPVDLKGAGGQQNNIGITVNINSDGSTTTRTNASQDERDGKQLAQTISAVVEQELIRQKRAGGMLSRYGA